MTIGNCTADQWNNFAFTHGVAAPAGHCRPTSLDELVGIVRQAEQGGRRVRAVGSSWSFSDVAVTTGYIVETNLLNNALTQVLDAVPSALNSRGASLKLVHVEAGVKLADLNTLLDSRNWALATMGGSSGQTLAGAVSTSVHGADFLLAPLPDLVRAIHLVGAGAIQHWIEPSDGITDPARLAAVLGLDPANIHYDDEWFNSVLVSMGTMGIIYSMIVEAREQYDLVEKCQHLSWEALRLLLESGAAFSGNRCVQVAVNPFKVDLTGTGNLTHPCYLITRTEAATQNRPASGSSNFAQVWHWVGWAAIDAMNLVPNLIETSVTKVTNDNLPEEGFGGQPVKQGIAHTIMASPDPPPAVGLGLEMAFDATNNSYLGFVDEALRILETAYSRDHMGLGGWFSLRFVGQSRAYLSPQHKSTRTCTVEATGLGVGTYGLGSLIVPGLNSTKPILDLLEAAGRRHGGIQHWGMFYNLAAPDVRRAYKDLDKWLSIRSLLTNNGLLHTFDNEFSWRCGLTRLPVRALRTEFCDHDGDSKPDFGVWRPATGEWWVMQSSDGSQQSQPKGPWIQPGDVPVPGDYDGDGRTDFAVWRPSSGQWFVSHSIGSLIAGAGIPQVQQWGQSGDVPVPADYDGDGQTDFAVWRPAAGMWYVMHSSDGSQHTQQWGQAGDIPVPGDYDMDGRTDFAVWRPGTGEWFVIHSSDSSWHTKQWGQAGDVPVPGDYDGDGKTDFAIWRPDSGVWWVAYSSDGTQHSQQWGQAGDVPVPGDYDTDGKTDFAVWRPTDGVWYVIHSRDGSQETPQWGQQGDIPWSARSNLVAP